MFVKYLTICMRMRFLSRLQGSSFFGFVFVYLIGSLLNELNITSMELTLSEFHFSLVINHRGFKVARCFSWPFGHSFRYLSLWAF